MASVATLGSTQQKSKEKYIDYYPRGGARELFLAKDRQVLLCGPADTGKSYACLQKLHLCASRYPGMRGLIVRKTAVSLTASVLVTYREKVLDPLDGVTFFGGSKVEAAQFRYPNGSKIMVGGMDKASKILSTEYDMIYINEGIELTENDYETLTIRCRNGVMPYQQVIADCNPDIPTHWLKARCDKGQTLLIDSRHADNPKCTPERLAILDALTGVRRLRYYLGQWAAAEGMVYEMWDNNIHLINSFKIPDDWRRFRVCDFGYSNPFTCSWFAVDGDGRMYLYRELYMTHRTVRVHAEQIKKYSEGERIETTVCDHDAEDRATLEENGIPTIAAKKDVSPGIQAVQERLKIAGDGKPRLFIMRDALIERDPLLEEAKKPCCTVEEIPGYVWPRGADGKPVKEQPVKIDDHGADCLRYAVQYVDGPSGRLEMHVNPFY